MLFNTNEFIFIFLPLSLVAFHWTKRGLVPSLPLSRYFYVSLGAIRFIVLALATTVLLVAIHLAAAALKGAEIGFGEKVARVPVSLP